MQNVIRKWHYITNLYNGRPCQGRALSFQRGTLRQVYHLLTKIASLATLSFESKNFGAWLVRAMGFLGRFILSIKDIFPFTWIKKAKKYDIAHFIFLQVQINPKKHIILIMFAIICSLISERSIACEYNDNDIESIRSELAEASRLSRSEIPTVVAKIDNFYNIESGVDFSGAMERIQEQNDGGVIVVLCSKKYIQQRSLVIGKSNVMIYGPGAEVYAEKYMDQLIDISGWKSGIFRVHLSGSSKNRGQKLKMVRLVLSGDSNTAYGNLVSDSGAAGIAAVGGVGFLIMKNFVRDTQADGIHVTQGSRDGIISENIVRNTGDDLIAVVSYNNGRPIVSNILIENNTVGGNRWGRGIAIIGGARISVINNTIQGVGSGASVRIAQEDVYNTYGVENVVIYGNEIIDTQTVTPPLRAGVYAPQGAIDIYAPGPHILSGRSQIDIITIKNNIIRRSRLGGITLTGRYMTNIAIVGNKFEDISRDSIVVDRSNGSCVDRCQIGGNYLGSEKIVDFRQSDKIDLATGGSFERKEK